MNSLTGAVLMAAFPIVADAQTAYVLFGQGYDAKPNDTFVQAAAAACCFGEYHSFSAAYWAQTLKATDRHPYSFTLGLANNTPADVRTAPFRFRLLLTEVINAGFRPGPVLWESDDLLIPVSATNYAKYTYKIRGVSLAVGRTYAWIIDTYTTRDGQQDAAAYFANSGTTSVPSYADGRLYAGQATGAGRTTDFAMTNWVSTGISAAFLVRYASPTH